MAARILIVEDNQHMIEVLQKRLENAGFTVLVAQDGQTGLDVARAEKPDLILLDVLLPKMNGYKVCRLLKFDSKYQHIPVFMLTSRVKDSDEQTGQQTGADEYIRKPYEPEKLMELIGTWLKRGKRARAGAASTA